MGRAAVRVEVWLASPAAEEQALACAFETLSPDERLRAERFADDLARRRFVTGRGVLRHLLAERLGVDPRAVEFGYGPAGKPFALAADRHAPGFNVAHSHEVVVIALGDAPGPSFGIDVEWTGARRRFDAIVRRYAAERERLIYFSLPESERAAAFWRWWTRKEAWVKAKGVGLARGIDGAEMPFDAQTCHRAGGYRLHTWELSDSVARPAPMASGGPTASAVADEVRIPGDLRIPCECRNPGGAYVVTLAVPDPMPEPEPNPDAEKPRSPGEALSGLPAWLWKVV